MRSAPPGLPGLIPRRELAFRELPDRRPGQGVEELDLAGELVARQVLAAVRDHGGGVEVGAYAACGGD